MLPACFYQRDRTCKKASLAAQLLPSTVSLGVGYAYLTVRLAELAVNYRDMPPVHYAIAFVAGKNE
ncbi:MAG: hypothetical protein V7K48_02550 [Nostoc sp.]|uniref:hypothetical protein n=1 Tax=Nostoc sp. TaxID=1180 RepID=UPI002FFD0FC6